MRVEGHIFEEGKTQEYEASIKLQYKEVHLSSPNSRGSVSALNYRRRPPTEIKEGRV
jgi:hypothetical protein